MVANKVYVVGVGMSKFIKPRGEVDYPGKKN
jgi:sterol carrier protein 2